MWGLLLGALSWIGLNPLPSIASQIGYSEPALKLLLSILMAYPMAIVYHNHVRKHSSQILKNAYFLILGLDTAFYNFGLSMYHNVIPVIVILITTALLGPGKLNAIATVIFNMGYLLVGYTWTESEDYDITWTMPHCVLTLKLIAFSIDLWDGQKRNAGLKIPTENKMTAICEFPRLFELFGFVYFPSCFLVGPIFSFRRYKDFVNDVYPLDAEAHMYQVDALKRLIQGMAYLIAFMIGVSIFSMKYMLSEEFSTTSIFYRHFYCGLWAHFALYKYIACWLLAEASCIRFGLSYNGMTKGPDSQQISYWDGCNNIQLLRFEGATRFQHYIYSFNCYTNRFAIEYVYKRLMLVTNRNLSLLFTLLFFALWHGTHSGYYVTFFNAFVIIKMEKEVERILNKTLVYQKVWANPIGKYILYGILKMYTFVFMGWSLVPFDLKVYNKWLPVYLSLWFSGFIVFVLWRFVYKPLLIEKPKFYIGSC